MYRADDLEITNPAKPNQVCLHLAASDGFAMMADGYGQYMFGFANVTGTPDADVMNMWDNPTNPGGVLGPNFPAPLIKLKQNDEVYLTLSNVGMMMRPDLFDPHTVHWHGFPQAASIFDGVPDASVSINMGSSLTYFYKAAEAGTFMYHCHVEATEHMQMGMLGNLYVSPVQDGTDQGNGFTKFAYNDTDGSTGYDKEYYLQIAAFDPEFHDASENTQPLPFALMDDLYPMINGRGYPDTVDLGVINNANGYASQRENARITVNAGDTRVLLRLSSLSTTSFHTITVLGLPMQLVGQGSRKLGLAGDTVQYRSTNSVTIGGGQSVDILLDVSGVSAGETYFLYVTNLDHLANNEEDFGGMMTEIVVE
jgi:FtsP/CotA-like multicopper oxidase with cupredoxin domain